MIGPCVKRLQKEISTYQTNKDDSIFLKPNPDNLFQWSGSIKGPVDSYYEGFQFDLSISIPQEYPLVPPIIKFQTKIFHPNVQFEVFGFSRYFY